MLSNYGPLAVVAYVLWAMFKPERYRDHEYGGN